jgi:hypothetical protein
VKRHSPAPVQASRLSGSHLFTQSSHDDWLNLTHSLLCCCEAQENECKTKTPIICIHGKKVLKSESILFPKSRGVVSLGQSVLGVSLSVNRSSKVAAQASRFVRKSEVRLNNFLTVAGMEECSN